MNAFDETLEESDQETTTPAPVNPFASTLEEMDRGQETQMRGAMAAAQQTTPDAAAEAQQLAERTGLPLETVTRNRDAIRQRAQIADTPYAQMLRETPHLAESLKTPAFAAIAHDDLEPLGALEWLMTAPQRAVAQGVNQVRFAQLKTEGMFRTLSQAEQDQLSAYRFHMDLGGELGAGGSWWRKAVAGAGQLLPNIAGGSAMAIKYGVVGALEGAAIGGAAGAVAGPGAGPAAIATAAYTGRAGLLYGAGKFGFELEAGLALDEYEKFTDETGQPMDPAVAKAAALATGLLNAGLEAYGLEKLAQSIPGVKNLTRLATRDAVKEALKRPTVRAGLAAAMQTYAGTLTAEVATEVAQRAATILSGELAKTASGQTIAHRTGASIFEDLITEGVGAVSSFGLAVLPGPTLQLAHSRQQAQAAAQNVEFFRDLGTGVAASKAAQRAPAAVQALLERAAAAGPVPAVYAPTDTWVEYWQSHGVDPAEMAATITGNPRALAEAQTTGNLEIPTAAYAVQLAPTEHNEFLAQELRMAPDEMNAREAVEFQAAEAAKAQQEEQAQLSPRDQIRQQMQARLEAAAVPSATAAPLATLVEHGIGMLSEDAGLDPVAVYERYGLTVQRPTLGDAGQAAAVSQSTTAEPSQITTSPEQAPEQLPLEGQLGSKVDPTSPRRTTYGPVMQALVEQTIAQNAAVRGTDADVPDNPAARALERMRRQDLAAHLAGGAVDNPTTGEETSADGERVEGRQGPGDTARELSPADAGGDPEKAGDGGRAQRRRLPTAVEIASTEGDAVFTKASEEADQARLTPEVTRELTRLAEELGAFPFTTQTWDWNVPDKSGNAAGGDANIVGGAAGTPLYDDILSYAPLSKSSKGAGAAKSTEQKRGQVEAAVVKLVETGRITTNIQEGAVRVAERRAADDYRDISRPLLPPTWGVEAPAEFVEALSDAVDAALEGDVEPSEFGQALLGMFDDAESPAVDTLDTGEQQPRLPGAEDVREQNIATPQLEAPFALTGEVSKAKKGTQTTLFQGAYHGSPHLFEQFSMQKIGSGEGAQSYGWGLYFASRKDVAEGYRDRLGSRQATITVAGEEMERVEGGVGKSLTPEQIVVGRLASKFSSARGGLTSAQISQGVESDIQRSLEFEQGRKGPVYESLLGQRRAIERMIEAGIEIKPTGRLYTVEIPEDDEMLDWDKHFEDQSSFVQERLESLGYAPKRFGTWEAYQVTAADLANYPGTSEGQWIAVEISAETGARDAWNGQGLASQDAAAANAERRNGIGAGGLRDKGEHIYQDFGGQGWTRKEVSEKLASAGIVGIKYLDQGSRAKGEGSHNYVIFDDDLVQVVEYEQDRRGSIVFGADRKVTINLFEKADLSTFLHETGHFFLEVFGDLVDEVAVQDPATLTEGQRRLLGNYGALLQQLGVEGRKDIQEAQHETFARLFEAYLREGTAPSLHLQEVFSRFRAWLLGVYRALRQLNATLTPEVRTVFDRMLATDQEIAAAEARGRFEPLFTTAKDAGMTPGQFELYRTTVADAHRRAQETLDAKLQGEVRREQERAWQTQRATIREAVAAQAYEAPVYQALAAMRYGQRPDGGSLVEGMEVPPLKLARQTIVDRYGADRLKRLPKPYIYARVGGVDPELVAERFGFSSGDELLTAVEQAAPMERAIDQETDRRMIEAHGSMLLDGTVADEAQAAAASTVRDGVLRAELRALWDLAGTVTPFVKQAVRDLEKERAYERRWLEAEAKLRVAIAEGRKQLEIDRLEKTVQDLKAKARGGAVTLRAGLPSAVVLQQAAEARIARTRVQDLKPAVYWSASRRAATKALEAAARQDYDTAIAAKTDELLQVNLYREAERAKADVAVRVKRAKDLGSPKSRARIGLAGSTYLEQIDGVLDRYSFATISAKALAKRANMRDWLEALEAAGDPVDDLPPELLDDLRRVDYQTVPYAELVGVTDGLAQLVHLARLKNRLLKSADARDFTATRDALVDSLRTQNVAVAHPLEFDTAAQRKHSIARAYASHVKIATWARMMDGGLDGGRMWEDLIRPINEAADREQTRRSEEGGLMAALLERHYPGKALARLKEKVFIPAIGGSLSKEARIAVLLTRGNADGLARLLADPTRRWTQAGLDAIAETLDANDLAFVNALWAHLERFWPEIAAKQKRLTGLEPEKVDAAPFTVRASDGAEVAMAGGYYPLLYDDRLSARAQRNTAVSEAKLASAAAYVSATTRRGHTKARVANVKLSVRLDLGVAVQHIDQVLHDLTHHEMLIDVTRLLRDAKVSEAIYETRGPAVYRQFTQALSAIAVGTSPESDLDKAATFMRTGAQIAGLGWNLWTGVQQPLGLFNGMERVGVKWVARGMARWFSDAATMQSTLAWIVDRSPFMAERSNTATQDLLQLRQALGTAGGWFDTLVRTVSLETLTQQHLLDSFLWHIGIMQRVADVPTWLGAYEKAMADPTNAADEARAAALADQAVIDSQGSGHIKDLADVQRGSGVAKLWLTFYSYGSTTINRAAAIADRGTRSPNAVATMLGHFLLLYVAPAAATVALANAVGKRDDEEPEGWVAAVAGESVSAALNGVVLLRELAGVLTDGEGTRGYAGPAGARLIETVSRAVQQVKQGEADEALFRALNAAAGVLFRYPAGQVQRTVDGLIALEEGRTHNPAALLFGAPPRGR